MNFRIYILFLACFLFSNLTHAQEDELGNWLMYFGTNRLSDEWSIHTEAQYRNHEVGPSIEQLLLRTGANYHISKTAIATFGYGFIANHVYESDQKNPEVTEHRIFQQLILINNVGRLKFEHRYRLEQRWVEGDYRNRVRYRLMVFLPLNKAKIEQGTVFLGIYDEVFMNTEQTFFDRNRLYGALGYQINKAAQVQVGYLYQRVNPFGKHHLQLGLVYNTDFRKTD